MRQSLASELKNHLPEHADQELNTWAEEVDRLEIPWFALITLNAESIDFQPPLYSGWPPYCFPQSLPLDVKSIKSTIAYLLENYEYLLALPTDSALGIQFHSALRLKIEIPPSSQTVHEEGFRNEFNLAIYSHFFADDAATALQHYQQSFDLAANTDQKSLVALYCSQFHCDTGRPDEAMSLCRTLLEMSPNEEVGAYLKCIAAQAFVQYATSQALWEKDAPYYFTLTREALAFFKPHHDQVRYAEILQHSAAIARKKGNFSEALTSLSAAQTVLNDLELPENLATVHLAKAEILTQWGQQNPAFYDQALTHFDLAQRVYTPESAPLLYSDIQLQVAILYAEKPGPRAQLLMWRSYSVQSFKNALNAAKPYPVQYAKVAHNYSSAFAKYGLELGKNENARALTLINSALSVRTAETYPLERAFSLLTLIEILWSKLEMAEGIESESMEQIEQSITEISTLTDLPEVIDELKQHRDLLENVRKESLNHA